MGLMEINDIYRKTIINLDFYIKNTQEKHIQLVKKQHQEDLNENKSITKLADNFRKNHMQQLDQDETSENNSDPHTQQEEQEEPTTRHPYMHFERINKKRRWQNNKRAGRFYEEVQKIISTRKGVFNGFKMRS